MVGVPNGSQWSWSERARQAGGELRADRPRDRACGAGAGPDWPDLAWSVGQLLPGDAELDHEPAGRPYTGDDPEGFVPRDEIVRYLQRYASSFGAPVREGVGVDSLEPGPNGGFLLRTSAGELQAASVVVCTGAYQRPHRPEVAAGFPHEVLVIDAEDYRSPAALPPGKVLVVGSGQTGCQLSEELHESGREVFLACGRAPWLPRRPGGRDIVTWLKETTFFDTPLSALPSPAARLGANLLVTGQRGGHDLHYRTLQAMGVQLLGRLAGVEGIAHPSPVTWPTRSPSAMPATPTFEAARRATRHQGDRGA